jgi:peptide/nickel transport system substrate-binding protein
MEIRQVEMGTFLTTARAKEKRFDLLITGFPGDLSLAYLASMFDSRQAGGSLDYAGFHTRDLDAAFAATRQATTRDRARAAWADVQRMLARDMPIVWIYHARGVQGLSSRLRNVRMDLRGEMPTVSVWDVAPATGGRHVAVGR